MIPAGVFFLNCSIFERWLCWDTFYNDIELLLNEQGEIYSFFLFFNKINQQFATCVQIRNAGFDRDHYLHDFGITIVNEMVKVPGRILNPPKLQYGGRVSTFLF